MVLLGIFYWVMELFPLYLVLIALGSLVGIIAAVIGIGGGVLFVPILVLIFDFDMKNAVGTSLLAVLITSISSATAYIKRKKVLYKLGFILEGASVPGAILGAQFSEYVPSTVLKIMFVLFLFIMAIEILRNSGEMHNNSDAEPRYKKDSLPSALVLSFLAGFLSASLGIGGGVLKVPIMIVILELPVHYAIGTSAFMIVITATAGILQHFYYGHIDLFYGGLLGVGALIGAQLGAKVSLETKPKKLRIIFGIIIILIALRMLSTMLI